MTANRAQRRGADGKGVAASNGGYRLPKRTMRLVFDGTDYVGADVTMSLSVKLGFYMDAVAMSEDLGALFEFLNAVIVEWNLVDDDGPIPADVDGFRRLDDLGFLLELMGQWEKAMGAAVSAGPKSRALSSNGGTSESPS
jgi:hypothetical protein